MDAEEAGPPSATSGSTGSESDAESTSGDGDGDGDTGNRASATETPTESQSAGGGEPQFTDDMSVDQAINVVPRGGERRNIDPETLGKPLQDLDRYEPCKPGSAKVKLRVAVWDGKAVGVDVTTTPKNEKLAQCIKGKVREITWDKKVKSLNTIEYQF